MSDIFNVKTDITVFICLLIAWITFVIIKVLFEKTEQSSSFFRECLVAFTKTSPIFVIVWLFYCALMANYSPNSVKHHPWPSNYLFDNL